MSEILNQTIEGHWSLTFSTLIDSGLGNLVFETQKIYGGDSGFRYEGTYQINNENIEATVDVIKLENNDFMPHVFGDFSNKRLIVTGPVNGTKISNGKFNAIGYVDGFPQKQILIQLSKQRDLD